LHPAERSGASACCWGTRWQHNTWCGHSNHRSCFGYRRRPPPHPRLTRRPTGAAGRSVKPAGRAHGCEPDGTRPCQSASKRYQVLATRYANWYFSPANRRWRIGVERRRRGAGNTPRGSRVHIRAIVPQTISAAVKRAGQRARAGDLRVHRSGARRQNAGHGSTQRRRPFQCVPTSDGKSEPG